MNPLLHPIRYRRRLRTQDLKPGDMLPPEAGPWEGYIIQDVWHGHYPFLCNYTRFTLPGDIPLEFTMGRSWRPVLKENPI